MARKTDGETDKATFQMDRFFQQNGEWFYMTREGEEHGPFESKAAAELDLADYIRHLRDMENFGQ